MNSQMIGFVYSILCRCVLNKEQMAKCESNECRPGDYLDDNMLLAESFVLCSYAKDIEDLATEDDEINKAWNEAFDFAESNQYFPWKFTHTEVDGIFDITAFNSGDSFRPEEWQELVKMELGETWNNAFHRIA